MLGLEVRVGRALPGPHGLKADILLAQELTQPLVGDIRDHPLSDQVVRELGQAPGRKRLVEVLWVAQRDPLDLLTLWQRERLRPATPIARIQRIEPVRVEVVDHVPDRVRVGEHDLADLRRGHALRGEQHDLRPAPRHDRPGRAPHDPQQPVALLAGDLPQQHPGGHNPSRSNSDLDHNTSPPAPPALATQPGKRCQGTH